MTAVTRASDDDRHDRSEDSAPPPPALPDFPSNFRRVQREMHPPQRGEYTLQEIADGVVAHGGPGHAPSYYNHFSTGARDNPGYKVLVGLARLYGVSIAEFAPETEPAGPDAPHLGPTAAREKRKLLLLIDQIDDPVELSSISTIVESLLRRPPPSTDR